jgi:hypothetical protein
LIKKKKPLNFEVNFEKEEPKYLGHTEEEIRKKVRDFFDEQHVEIVKRFIKKNE